MKHFPLGFQKIEVKPFNRMNSYKIYKFCLVLKKEGWMGIKVLQKQGGSQTL